MKLLQLSWRYLWARPLATVLNLLLLTLGLAAITLVLLTRAQLDRAFERDLAGIDAVVGAKGSPLQLILSGVFHLDVPPGNILLRDAQALARDARVAQLIPLSLGDSYRGFRIVGTTHDYPAHYGAQLAQGRLWQQPMEVVLGHQAAQATGLQPGQPFAGSHGLADGGAAGTHAAHPYVVSGVLAPCACVLDRLLLTATESVWEVHEVAHGKDDDHDAAHEDEKREITLALVRYRSPLAAATFPRHVNTTTNMQAAAPALEITRLLRMVGVGADVLRGFALVLLLSAGLSVFIALWSAVRERREDLALLRMLGAPPRRLAALLLCEAFWLAALATGLGLLGGHLLTGLLGYLLAAEQSLPMTGWLWLGVELWVPALALTVAVLAALLPALGAYRMEAGQLLNSR
ncbi:FtsX-like permease family protein [Curvibacter sp. PAE-UM]|uniref:FtsX-like permease family protein n=1 Tax=Curvibacter sp. PAE-UM TaxID=1714344 RepID=UPI000710FDC9|nr:FtsX-like permease family protein [Curvibacter sp. PAE-UM]KRH98464.1 multidrug ABC transporter substrate-binding protein [Curvibacter sp. PAE-UM]